MYIFVVRFGSVVSGKENPKSSDWLVSDDARVRSATTQKNYLGRDYCYTNVYFITNAIATTTETRFSEIFNLMKKLHLPLSYHNLYPDMF